MTINDIPKYNAPHWKDRRPDGWRFIASVVNESSGLWYDIYWVNGESWTCQHGNEPWEYGSGNLDWSAPEDRSEYRTIPTEDYLFGIAVAQVLCSKYLDD